MAHLNEQPTERLNKFLALQLGISRREADNLIEQGNVSINGRVAPLGARVHSNDKKHITLNDQPVETNTDFTYVSFHKPVGYVCSRKAQGDSPTIYSLLPEKYHQLKPVGRLDKDSSGILLLSNDGDFAYQMTHPKFHKQKEYEIGLDHELAPLHQQMISDYGVQLEDGVSSLALERMTDSHRKSWRILMHEGRNRQIRRTFAALGYTVTRLHRTRFGNYNLTPSTPGKWQEITIHQPR